MSIEANKQLMNKFVQFINTRNENLAKELVSANAQFYIPGEKGPKKGPQGYLDIIDMMRSGFPDIQWTLEEMISEDDKVAARFIMRGTHLGTFMGVPASEKAIEVQAMNIYYFENNQIVQEYGQPDLIALLGQIGALPSSQKE